jgi:adenylate kinase
MIVVVTGMIGVDKKSYLQSVLDVCSRHGKEVLLFNVGDLMYAESPEIPKGRILDISLKHLDSLRRSVFKDIIAKKDSAPNIIVNTHATFRWRHGLFPAVDFDQMRLLNADMYVCLIDGVDVLHVRLNKEHQITHSLKDLLVWREEEILGTQLLCRGINETTPLYALSRGHDSCTAGTFYNLMFEPKLKKAYLSFPMTHVIGMPDVLKKIDEFRSEMEQHLICFDPADVEESGLPYYARQAVERGESHIEVTSLGKKVRLDANEVLQIERDINSQIYARDFMLIDQSDMIVSYIPGLPDGKAAISSGVEREMQHAYEGGKEAYVIWTANNDPSVFVKQTATVFRTTAEAIEHFRKKKYLKG